MWTLPVLAAGLLALGSCVQEKAESVTIDETVSPEVTAVIAADETRTVVDADLNVLWEKGDRISVFVKSEKNRCYELVGEGGEASGTFKYVSGAMFADEAPYYYGVYPYNKETTLYGDGTLSVTIPAVQPYLEDSFAPGINVMAAASEDLTLSFKNVCGYVQLKLYGAGVTVKSLVLKGNNGEEIAGSGDVLVKPDTAPELTLDGGAATEITVEAETPVTLGETEEDATVFWFVVAPTTFSEGFTVQVLGEDGEVVFEKATEQEVEIVRNQVYRLKVVEVITDVTAKAKIAWTWAEDAEVDHNLFYETGEKPTIYSRKALPLEFPEGVIEEIGSQLDGKTPTSVTVTYKDEGEDVPVDYLKISNFALKDGKLTADVEDFEWDKTYTVDLKFGGLTVIGTLTTVDRNREAVVIPGYEYTFDIGKLNEETGFGYVEPESSESTTATEGYYHWEGESIAAAVFAAFKEAAVIAAEAFADLNAFSAAELVTIMTGNPSGDPESASAYVRINEETRCPLTTSAFTEAVLKGTVFSSGVADADVATQIVGNTVYLYVTTYIGERVEIPFTFNYRSVQEQPSSTVLFKEDFENNFRDERMSDWTFLDADGDGEGWYFVDDDENGIHFNHFSGTGHITSASWVYQIILYPDNWAVTPAFTLSKVSNYLSFWIGAQDPSFPEEYYAVYLTTDEQPSSDPDDYTVLMGGEILGTSKPFETYANGVNVQGNAYTLYRYVIQIPDKFNGKTVHIAFRHYNCSDVFRLNLDDVYVTSTKPVVGDQESIINPKPELNPNETLIYSTTFDTEDELSGWVSHDADGDGNGWFVDEDAHHGGSGYSMSSTSYAQTGILDPDNWLISPAITLGSGSHVVRFWALSSSTYFPDHYGVYVAEDPKELDDSIFASADSLFSETASSKWHQVDVMIPDRFKDKTVRILFRHYDSYNNWTLSLDDVWVVSVSGSSPSQAPAHAPAHAPDQGGIHDRKIAVSKRLAPDRQREDVPAPKSRPLPAWKQ